MPGAQPKELLVMLAEDFDTSNWCKDRKFNHTHITKAFGSGRLHKTRFGIFNVR